MGLCLYVTYLQFPVQVCFSAMFSHRSFMDMNFNLRPWPFKYELGSVKVNSRTKHAEVKRSTSFKVIVYTHWQQTDHFTWTMKEVSNNNKAVTSEVPAMVGGD